MKNISIPTPCHENWEDFTPTQKGAFCGSCQIDVFDFSNKSPNEIKQILKENAGKHLCGRFKKSQLDELNDNFYAWENQSPRSFQSKFLYACLVAFGMTLFTSCETSDTQMITDFTSSFNITASTGSSESITTFTIDKDTTKKIKPDKHHVKGKIAYTSEQEEEFVIPELLQVEDTTEQEVEIMMLGEIAIAPESNIYCTPDIPEDTLVDVVEDTLYDDQMIDGEIELTPEFITYVEDSIKDVDNEATLIINKMTEITEGQVFETKLFPNPTTDLSNFVLNVQKETDFDIYLYALNGKQIKHIYKGELPVGERKFQIDLAKFSSGSYLLVVQTDTQKESLKIQKL
ncbi:T9SS type A sorting domain-containing protein [Paracrocinitomix mangrovi]|uniref:T9SS type A sorting domain-containing protein n=1 Tax=Paracrocinitomix mangrovi TaxID=2862509 RepID=UPI001C8DC1AE|nr:T9SS type A sorting domain-containing protein [Paracrocinitomix mangrovi]UKN02770.1 T9SS type A sorting domain-containing protein [Paracrocinitomix mangrovi]